MWVAMNKVHQVEVVVILFLACIFVQTAKQTQRETMTKTNTRRFLNALLFSKSAYICKKKHHVKNDHAS